MEHILPNFSKQKAALLRLLKPPLLLLLCLFADTSYAQEQSYKSIFGATSTEWTMIPRGYCDGTSTISLKTSGTTIINDKEYIIISGLLIDPENEGKGFLREDTQTGRIWMYDKSRNREYLLMDMTLEPGDKFTLYDYYYEPVEVTVSEVYYKDNIKRIRFGMQDAWIGICVYLDPRPSLEFIEGTGPNAGFFNFHSFYQRRYNSYLLCHFKDAEKVYSGNQHGGACFITDIMDIGDWLALEDETIAAAGVEVYPNPAAEDVRVSFNNPRHEQAELLVFDVLSRPVYRFTGRGSEFQLSLRDKPAGVYFYRLHLNQKQIATGKIIRP